MYSNAGNAVRKYEKDQLAKVMREGTYGTASITSYKVLANNAVSGGEEIAYCFYFLLSSL